MAREEAAFTPEALEKKKKSLAKYHAARQKKRDEIASYLREKAPGDWTGRGVDSIGRGFGKREKDAQINRAVAHTEKSVDNVFNFLNKLIARGTEIVEKPGPYSPSDLTVLGEARLASTKLLDKTVADASVNAFSKGSAGTAVQIVIGAPLSRMIEGGAPMIVETVNGREQDTLQTESIGDSDS